MKYDVVIFEGTGPADCAGPATPAIRLEGLSLREVDALVEPVHRNGLFICFIPHETNG